MLPLSRVPTLESVIEFLIGMSTGDVEKGGSREKHFRGGARSPCPHAATFCDMWGPVR